MRTKFIYCWLVIPLIISSTKSFAQNDTAKAAGLAIVTAEALTSGNYKDVLNSFYQLALKNLTGPDKDLHFTSNPYALMLKNNPDLAKDVYYLKYSFWRRLNFDFDAKLDSAYRFNGFSMGVKFELLNKRDVSMSKAIGKLIENNPNDKQYHDLLVATFDNIDDLFFNQKKIDAATHTKLVTELSKATNDSISFDELDPIIQKAIRETAKSSSNFAFFDTALANNPHLNIYTERNKGFHEIMSSFEKKPLWTLGINDTSYTDGRLSKSLNISSEFLLGIVNPSSAANLELDIKASANFTADTLSQGRNLNRHVFNFEPGINFVLKGSQTQKPYLEFKISGEYKNVWEGTLYADEKHINNTINSTIRLRVFNDVWIPVEMKFDTHGNVFGFLSVTANFTALSNLFKSPAL